MGVHTSFGSKQYGYFIVSANKLGSCSLVRVECFLRGQGLSNERGLRRHAPRKCPPCVNSIDICFNWLRTALPPSHKYVSFERNRGGRLLPWPWKWQGYVLACSLASVITIQRNMTKPITFFISECNLVHKIRVVILQSYLSYVMYWLRTISTSKYPRSYRDLLQYGYWCDLLWNIYCLLYINHSTN